MPSVIASSSSACSGGTSTPAHRWMACRSSGSFVVGVVGFDDSSWAQRCYPPLSTVHQPAAGLGERAAELVVRQLAGEDVPPGGTILESPVVWRESA